MPSLQIVSKVVGRKVSQRTELKQSLSKQKKSGSESGNTKGTTGTSCLKVGSKVKFPLSNRTAQGILRFIGPTRFSTGLWCGIELSRPDGRNNGTVKGVKYFNCKFNYGIFVHAEKVTLVEEGDVVSAHGKSTSEQQLGESEKKSCCESVENEGLKKNHLNGSNNNNNNNSFADDWVVCDEEKPRNIKKESEGSLSGLEELCGATRERPDAPLSNTDTGNKSEKTESALSIDNENSDMRTIFAAAVEVENSPLTIKIAKSVSDEDSDQTAENVTRSEFENGLLFYVTATTHQAAPISQKDRHKSCPALSSSSSDEEIFADENKCNTWPKYPKNGLGNWEDERCHNGPTKLRRRPSGIEKRIRLSHFRPLSPGSLRKSLSQSAVYPKENYVAYDESAVRRVRFPVSLKRSVSNVTEYNSSDAIANRRNRSSEVNEGQLVRRERATPLQSFENDVEDGSGDEDKTGGYEGAKPAGIHNNENDIDQGMKIEDEKFEDIITKIDENDLSSSSFVVIDDIIHQEEKEADEQTKVTGNEGPNEEVSEGMPLSSTSFVEEDLVVIDKLRLDEIMVEDERAIKEPVNDFQYLDILPSKKGQKSKHETQTFDTSQKSLSVQQGSGLTPLADTQQPQTKVVQNKVQPASKIATKKASFPVLTRKKESSSSVRPMSNRLSNSYTELPNKAETPRASVDNKGRLPKKLNKRVSDLVANFEKTKDGCVKQKESKGNVAGSSSDVKIGANSKKQPQLGKRREATSEKESKSTGLAVTPRKTSQVNKEELAGKEVLSKQYFKDDGNKKLGHIHKDASAGNQATPRSGISTGRSGIPGYTKRSQKTSAETPKKPQVSYKFSASKQEKPDDVSQLSSGKDRNLNSKTIEPSNKAQEQIKELKNKCLDCEKKINDLKIGLNEKNLAMEAFVIIIRRYIENIEEQNGRQVQLLKDNKQLGNELEHQKDLAVSNVEKCRELEKTIASLTDDCREQIDTLKTAHERETGALLKQINQIHEQEMGQANAKFDKEIAKLKDYHDDKISKLQAEHEEAMKNLQDDFQKTFNLKEEEFSQTKEDITNSFNKEKEEISLEYEERLQDLQNQLSSSEQQCYELEVKARELQFELDKDLESKIQGALAKYKDLPAELESLQAVVEMKNEDIKKSRAHNMELQKKLEDYYELEKKYVKLSQEKEAIDAALQNKVKCERQLSVEKESLQANLEKEARKVKRLSMEKEELLWKVSNASSSLSLSSPALNMDLSSTPNGFQSTPNTARSINRSLKTQSLYLPPLDDEDYTVL